MNINASFAGILAVVLWAAIPAFVKTGVDSVDLTLLLVMRFVISTALLIKWIWPVLQKFNQIPLWLWGALTITLGSNYYFQGLAMASVPVSWYVVIFSLNPIFVLLLMRTQLHRAMILPLVAAMIGSLLFIDRNELASSIHWTAFLFLCIGMLTWVVYTLLISRFQKVYNDLESTTLTQIASLIATLSLWIYAGTPTQGIEEGFHSAFILGITTPVAYFGFTYCLRRLPVFGVVSQYLEPVVGVVIGVCFFHETLSTIQVLGSVAILFGMAKLPLPKT